MCPNCGAKMPFRNDMCQACYWDEDSEHFCPHWMKLEDWELGMATNWEHVSKKGKRKLKKDVQHEDELKAMDRWGREWVGDDKILRY